MSGDEREQGYSDYNTNGMKHCCTYLDHQTGENYRRIEKERDMLKAALEKIADGNFLMIVQARDFSNEILDSVDASRDAEGK